MTTAATSIELPLPIVLTPFSDESFLGYLTRIARAHLRQSAVELALLAGVQSPVLSELQRKGTGEAAIAELCGIAVAELRIRRHASFGGRHEPVQLAAGAINAHLVRSNRPRIAPSTYAQIGYHRYEWDFEFLTFDPETGENLIDACPHCQEGLSWSRPDFLTCVSCGRPLAGQEEQHVDEDTRVVGRFFADILSLDEGRRREARSKLAPETRDLPTEALFRFLFEISGLFEFKKYAKRERPTELQWPSILIRAYQVATDWPAALLSLLEETRLGASERVGRHGVRKEFGDLAVLLREWDGIAEIMAVVLPVIREYLNLHPDFALKAKSRLAQAILPESRYATLKEIQHQFRWAHRKATRLLQIPGVVVGSADGSGAPIQIDRQKVAEIHDALAGLITKRTIRNIWGLSHEAIVEIADTGLFKAVTEPYVTLVQNADGLYSRAQVSEVIAQAYECQTDESFEGFTLSFNRVVHELGDTVQKPWATTLSAVLEGQLKPVKISKKEKRGFGRIRFEKEEAYRWIAARKGQGEHTFSLEEVKRRLGTHMDVVYWLVEKGLLKAIAHQSGKVGRRISNMELIRVESEYITAASLSKRFKSVSNFVNESLDLLGAKPIPGVPNGRRLYRLCDLPRGFRVLSRTEIYERRRAANLPVVPHCWR